MKSVKSIHQEAPKKEHVLSKVSIGAAEKILPLAGNTSGSLVTSGKVGLPPEVDDDLIDADDEPPPINVNDVVDNRFKVLQVLGQGGFGAVFEVNDMESKTKETYALKIELEPTEADEPGLMLEAGVLKRLQKNHHFPKFVKCALHGNLTYLVMQLCGDSLYFLRRKCTNKHFSLNTTLQLSQQSFDAIEYMHKMDLIHRDIKPDNFLVGSTPKDTHTLYLVDFGLVRQFRISGKIRPERQVAAYRGTVGYGSINVLSNKDACRADDLISWLYVMIECLKGSLPWSPFNVTRRKLAASKAAMSRQALEGTPPTFTQIYDLLTILRYGDEPPYGVCSTLLRQTMQREKVRSSDPFDFERGGCQFDQVFSKIGAKRAEMRRQQHRGQPEQRRRSRDELTMRQVSYRFHKDG